MGASQQRVGDQGPAEDAVGRRTGRSGDRAPGGEQLPGPMVCALSRLVVPPKPSFYSTYGKHLQFCWPNIPGFTFAAVDLIVRVEMEQQGPSWTRDPCLDQQRVPSLWTL